MTDAGELRNSVKYLSLTLREPPERRNPMHTFVADREAYERATLLAWNTPVVGLDVLLFRVSGPTDAYRDALADARFVEAFDVTRIDDDRFYAYVEHRTREADRDFREAILAKHLLVVPPITFEGTGTTRLRVVGRPADLEAVLDDVPEETSVTVRAIGEYDAPRSRVDPSLTDRQREAITAASEVGYYDVPRTGSVAEVADRLGCAESTASNHLRKAEARLVGEVV
jgi:hypothetical protein